MSNLIFINLIASVNSSEKSIEKSFAFSFLLHLAIALILFFFTFGNNLTEDENQEQILIDFTEPIPELEDEPLVDAETLTTDPTDPSDAADETMKLKGAPSMASASTSKNPPASTKANRLEDNTSETKTPVKPKDDKSKTIDTGTGTKGSASVGNAKTEAEKKAEEEAAIKAKKEAQKQKYGSLFGSGKGNSSGNGNGGDPNGDPNATNLGSIGKGSGRVGGGLNARGVKSAPTINDSSQKTGKVVVKICVDKNGKVTEAVYTQKGSTTTDTQLVVLAEKAAMKYIFEPSSIESQCGTVTIDFKLQ